MRRILSLAATFVMVIVLSPSATAVVTATPGTPFDPKVLSHTQSSVSIEWSAPLVRPDAVNSYAVRYSSDSGANWSLLSEADATDTVATISGLNATRTYLVQVAAVGSAGTSAWTAVTPQPKKYTQIDVSKSQACAVVSDGSIDCWGYDWGGNLGSGVANPDVFEPIEIPIKVVGVSNAVQVSQTCALLRTGQVKCWGQKLWLDGNQSDDPTLMAVPGISDAVFIDGGGNYFDRYCALRSNGQIACWGSNINGTLGDGTTNSSEVPVVVQGITTAMQLSVGSDHSCAVLANKHVTCWGSNLTNQLGRSGIYSSNVPLEVPGITNAVSVAAGQWHTCALLETGTVKCWGTIYSGILGDGTDIEWESNSLAATPDPVTVTVLGNNVVESISAGNSHTCAVLVDNHIKCWGLAHSGELGDGTLDGSGDSNVVDIDTASAVAVGDRASCALLEDGSAKCWGWNFHGVIRTGLRYDEGTVYPTNVDHTISVTAMSAASSSSNGNNCAITSDGKVRCAGNQIDGVSTGWGTLPIEVRGIANVVAIAGGDAHTCVVISTGSVKCWGSDRSGGLGDGPSDSSPGITNVVGISTAIDIAANSQRTCVVVASGSVKCWGENNYGQLGNGTTIDSNIPVSVVGISTAVTVSTNYYSSCALLADSTVKCWGYGVGGTNEIYSTPVSLSGVTGVTKLSESCAVLVTKRVTCWGQGAAQEVSGITSAVDVVETTSDTMTCILLESGQVKCWGFLYRLGLDDSETPISVPGITNARAFNRGQGGSICAILQTSEVKCWGEGGNGDPTFVDDTEPGLRTYNGTADLKISLTMAPARVASVSLTSAGGSSFKLGWTAAVAGTPAVTAYYVEWATMSSGWKTITSSTNFATIGGLEPSTNYRVRVTACNAAGCAPVSSVGSFATSTGKPTAVTKVVSKSLAAKSNKLTWSGALTNGYTITKYEVRWKLATSSSWGAWKSYAKTTTATIKGWVKSKKYSVQIRVTNAKGNATSKTFTVTQTA